MGGLNSKRKLALRVLAVATLIFGSVICRAADDGPCTKLIYPKGQPPSRDAVFDKTFDTANKNGWSFSCGPQMSATEARKALESFRYGVLYNDKVHINAV